MFRFESLFACAPSFIFLHALDETFATQRRTMPCRAAGTRTRRARRCRLVGLLVPPCPQQEDFLCPPSTVVVGLLVPSCPQQDTGSVVGPPSCVYDVVSTAAAEGHAYDDHQQQHQPKHEGEAVACNRGAPTGSRPDPKAPSPPLPPRAQPKHRARTPGPSPSPDVTL